MQFDVLKRSDIWSLQTEGKRLMFGNEGVDLNPQERTPLKQMFDMNLQYVQAYLDSHENDNIDLNCNRLNYKYYLPKILANKGVVKEQKVHVDYDPKLIV